MQIERKHRAAGGSSGVEEELRWRAAEQESCGEGQQSRRVAVKGDKRVELQVEQQRTVRRKIELISNR